MKSQILVSLLGSILITGCEGSQLNEMRGSKALGSVSSHTGDAAPSSPYSTTTPAEIDPSVNPVSSPESPESPGSTPLVNVPPVATIPVSIGGAFLSCQISKDAVDSKEVTCKTSVDSKPVDVKVAKAFVVVGPQAYWKLVSFERKDLGTYLVSIPFSMASMFAVILQDDVSAIAVSMVGSGKPEYKDYVKNGSFEAAPITNVVDHYFYYPESEFANLGWKAKAGVNHGCAAEDRAPIIEVQSVGDPTFLAAEGRQWVELDSVCSKMVGPNGLELNIVNQTPGGNIQIYQDIALPLKHVVQIQFSYRHSLKDDVVTSLSLPFEQKIKGMFGNAVILPETPVKQGPRWIEGSATQITTSQVTTLSFEELGNPNSAGTLLDNVRVYDLGTGEAPVQ